MTPPTQPIAFARTENLTRTLGNLLWISAYPALHLSEAFRLYGSISYYQKQADRYSSVAAVNDPAVLELQTGMRALSLGAGIAYRVTARSSGLPIDAGVSFQQTVSGSGGFTPRQTVITMYLRAYYRLWGTRGGENATR